MKVHFSGQYRTIEGRKVELLGHYPGQSDRPYFIGCVFYSHGDGVAAKWYEDGLCAENPDYALEEVPPRIERELWLNLYKDHDTVHASKWQADHADFHYQKERINPRLACVSTNVDCEVGAGIEA